MENEMYFVPKDAKFGDEVAPDVVYVGQNGKHTVFFNKKKGIITYVISPEDHKEMMDNINKWRNRPWWKKILGID